jgi:outer membrane receptor for ferrienterochelin and colicins
LYYRFLSPSNFYQVIGNPTLRPEHANSWQFGAEYTATARRARVGLNVFRNDVADLIDSVTIGSAATVEQLAQLLAREGLDASFRPVLGRPILTYRNVFDVVTQGIEVDADAALVTDLTLGAAYTYLSAFDADDDRPLTGRHRHHGHVRLSWHPRGLGLRAAVRGTFFSSWIAARTMSAGTVRDTVAPAFALWDASLSKRLPRGLTAFLSVENLTNSRDPNTGVLLPTGVPAAIYRPEAGRAARVGIEWSFTRR